MFILVSLNARCQTCKPLTLQTTISDLVQISPEDIEKPSGESLEDNINAKYANKVRRHGFATLFVANVDQGHPKSRTLHLRLRHTKGF